MAQRWSTPTAATNTILLRGPVLPALGAAVWLVPGHCDPTVNLHAAMVGCVGAWSTAMRALYSVDARGALT